VSARNGWMASRERAALHTDLDRALSLVAMLSWRRALGPYVNRYETLLERELRVRRIIRECVDHALGYAGGAATEAGTLGTIPTARDYDK
jgi:hypothetical protein